MTTSDSVKTAAARLFRARLERRPIAPLTAGWPTLTESEAYAIAEETARLRQELGVGFKLGYTSAAMRLQMKVDAPNFGVLFASTRIEDGAGIASAQLIHPLVEPEIAVLLASQVDDDTPSHETVYAAIDAVLPALEVVDTRYEQYDFKAVDNIADNSSAARYLVGKPQTLAAIGDLRAVATSLWSNGRTLARGIGADVMGDPLRALAWFLGRRARDGSPVPAGSLILTGGITSAHAAPPGSSFVAEFGSLGMVKVYFDV